MKSTIFQIEYIYKKEDYGLIFVKYLSGEKEFEITSESKLGNIELEEYLDMPRKIDENGKLMLDSFIFKPKNKSDLNNFEVGQVVRLKQSNNSTSDASNVNPPHSQTPKPDTPTN